MTAINNINDLVLFIRENNLSNNTIANLLQKTLGIYLVNDFQDKEQLVKYIEQFYYKYPKLDSRPLFIDIK